MSLEDLILVAAIVIVCSIADRLDERPGGGYNCPKICDVDHIHYVEQDTIKIKGDIDGLDFE